MGFAGAMVVAMAMDALVGWPDRLFARIGHPVTWLGRLIAALDARWNRESRSGLRCGALRVLPRHCSSSSPRPRSAGPCSRIVPFGLIGGALLGLLAWPFVAFRSLYDHVAAVRDPLRRATSRARERRLR